MKHILALQVSATIIGSLVAMSAQADVVLSWGANTLGQLGIGTYTSAQPRPLYVEGLPDRVSYIAAGGSFGLAVQSGGVWEWGLSSDGSTSPLPQAVAGLEDGITAVAAGLNHRLAIRNGAALAWGPASWGELGNGTDAGSSVPVQVTGMTSGVTAIAGGSTFSLAVRNGAAWAWGSNFSGELGNGSFVSSTVPVPVTGLESGVTAVATAWGSSIAIQNGAVWAWGSSYGTVPRQLAGLTSGVTSIAASEDRVFAVKDGDLYGYSQLFGGTWLDLDLPLDLVSVAVGGWRAYGWESVYLLSSDGTLWVWGRNDSGQLGIGTFGDWAGLHHVLPPAGFVFSSIDSYADFAVATVRPVPAPASWALLAIGALFTRTHRRA